MRLNEKSRFDFSVARLAEAGLKFISDEKTLGTDTVPKVSKFQESIPRILFLGGFLTRLKNRDGSAIPFTAIPNGILRSEKLCVYDKLIYALLASCSPAYPSYAKLQQWSGLSKDRVWKSLRELERRKIIVRLRRGRSLEYKTYLSVTGQEKDSARRKTFPPDGPINATTSPPHGPDESATRTPQKATFFDVFIPQFPEITEELIVDLDF